jgi:hypothetical protein
MSPYSRPDRYFKDVCVYRIGNHAGFFSEINNMIMAMIYCYENKIKFKLYSIDTLYCDDLWNDFLNQFTDKVTHPFHQVYNGRDAEIVKKSDFDGPEFRDIRQYLDREFPDQEICLTQNIWPHFRNHKIYGSHHHVDTNVFRGYMINVGHQIINAIWSFTSRTRADVRYIKKSIRIDTPYAGLHIRRGDKLREAKFKPLQDYLKIVDTVTKQENFPVFVATDDQRVIEDIKKLSPKRPVYHFVFPENNGFDMDKFSVLNKQQQKQQIIQLLAEVEMLIEAQLFVGSFTSNVGMFVGMARDGREIYGVDTNGWVVW